MAQCRGKRVGNLKKYDDLITAKLYQETENKTIGQHVLNENENRATGEDYTFCKYFTNYSIIETNAMFYFNIS